MLEVLIGSIIDYFKISDFSDKSIETSRIRIKEYKLEKYKNEPQKGNI